MTAPSQDHPGGEVDHRPSTPHESGGRRGRRRHGDPAAEQTLPSPLLEEPVTTGRPSRLVPFPVTAEGIVDLPDGAVVVALDFTDDGGFGSRRRPGTAWVAVATGDSSAT
jgi:hypothetical protein